MENIAENGPPLNLDFIGGQFSAPFSKIPSEMHYMNNKILKNRNLLYHHLEMLSHIKNMKKTNLPPPIFLQVAEHWTNWDMGLFLLNSDFPSEKE